MSLLRLNRINRLFLLAWTGGIVALAVQAPAVVPSGLVPTAGPLATLSTLHGRYIVLVTAWVLGVVLTLAWQRTLWTTMGSGAGLIPEGGRVPGLRLPPLQGRARERIVTATAVRRGWSPLARLRVETTVNTTDPVARLELAITSESDPDGRVLFAAPDADRRYVLRDGAGDVEAVLPTDYRAEILDVETLGVLRADGSRASFELSHVPFDAGRLRTCAETTVKLAEQVERAADDRRSG